MALFSSEYECKLDAKGRLVLPAKLKSALPEADEGKLVLLRGFEPCLVLYPLSSWSNILDQVASLNEFNEQYRHFQRNFLRGNTEVELDSAGRFIIPKSMAAYAGLQKDVIVVGLGNRMELWDENRYQDALIKDSKEFSKLAQQFLSKENGPGSIS
jgi:MraZ protein